MSVHRPQDVDIFDETDVDPDVEVDVSDDSDREVVDQNPQLPTQLPDGVDPADYYEQSLIVDYDEDDYR